MERKEYKLLNIIRIPAFLSVFLFHATIMGEEAKWSISLFLILSGFLTAFHGYDRKTSCKLPDLVRYGIKKVRNLYPLHVIMSLVAFGLYAMSVRSEIATNVADFVAGSVVKLLANVMLISGWGPKIGVCLRIFSEYNIVAWYLSLCFLLFILTPVFMKIMHALYDDKVEGYIIKPILVSIVLFAAAVISNLFFMHVLEGNEATVFIYENPVTRIWEYLIAMQAGYIYRMSSKKNSDTNFKWYAIALVVSIGVLVYELIATRSLDREIIWIASSGFYFVIPVLLVVYFTARVEGIRHLDNPVINWLSNAAGLVQYAFLIHVPVINLVHAIYKRVAEVNTLVWCAISFAITIALAYGVSAIKKLRTNRENGAVK